MIEVLTSGLTEATTQRIALALLHFLWQGLVLAIVLAGVLKWLYDDARDSASRLAHRRYLWSCATLLLMAISPLINYFVLHVPQDETTIASRLANSTSTAAEDLDDGGTTPAAVSAEHSTATPFATADGASDVAILESRDDFQKSWFAMSTPLVLRSFFFVWFVGVVFLSAWHLIGWSLMQRFRWSGKNASPQFQQFVDEIASRLGIRQSIAVRHTAQLAGPAVMGLIKPLLIIPASVASGLAPNELEAIIAHELAHIKRHDYCMNLMQSFIETTLFYHPAVWWVSRQIRLQREFCTDDIALQVCPKKEVYVQSLINIAELALARPSHALAATDGQLTARVRRLLQDPRPHVHSSWTRRSAFVSFAALAVLTASVSGLAQHRGSQPNDPNSLVSKPSNEGQEPAAEEKKHDAVLPPNSLAAAIQALNKQAENHPESRDSRRLKEADVIQAIRALKNKPQELSEAEFATLQKVAQDHVLPNGLELRLFVRSGNDSQMQHGRWVRLVLDRKSQAPFVLAIVNQSHFARPLTLLERADQDAIRKRGGSFALNRFVSYFPDDARMNEKTPATVDYGGLISTTTEAIKQKDLEGFAKLFYWRGVHRNDASRKFVQQELASLVKRGVSAIEFQPRMFKGKLSQHRAFYAFASNTTVEGYLRFTYADKRDLQPQSLSLEVGPVNGKPRFVAYIVSSDTTKQMLGKRLSSSITMGGGFNATLDEDWYESSVRIQAPRELAFLEQASLELWRRPLRKPAVAENMATSEALKALLSKPKTSDATQPVAEADSAATSLIAGLRKTENSIKSLAVTTDYVKHQLFMLPVEKPIELKLVTKAIIETGGRAWNETRGQQVNIEPDGKSVRLYDGHWTAAFDGKTARQLRGSHSATLDNHISWHGVNPQLFTTHYFNRPVSELLKEKGANIVRQEKWDGRDVTVVDTTATKIDRKYRFWIDPERMIVVRRAALVRYKKDQPYQEYTRIESTGHKQVDGIWLPSGVKYESVEVTPELTPEVLSWRYEGVNRDWKVNQKYDDEQFVLQFPPNAFVNDHRRPKPPKPANPPKPRKDE